MPAKRHPDAAMIHNLVWDATIGAGRVGEDFPDEPDYDFLKLLARQLKRELTADDRIELERAWKACEMDQAFP